MCGIWAIFGSDENVWAHCSSFMSTAHRGPDCFRIENVPHYTNCVMGFHRLAIMDGLHGMQPLKLHGLPHLCLCFNGEIYNCQRLKEEFSFEYETFMDGESILHLYNKGGVEFMAQHLDGVFGVCLLDTKKQEVHLVRDTFGVKPLFTLLTENGTLAASSEAKGLSDLVFRDGETTKISPFPIGHYESYRLLSSGKVELKARRQFHKVGTMPIYKTPVTPGVGGTEEVIQENIRVLLKAAVKKRFMAERRIGCLLSGGLDSSLVTALAVEIAKEEGVKYPIQTFSTGMEGSPDILAARKVAAHLGTEHHEVLFTSDEAMEVIDDVIYHLETYDTLTMRGSIAMHLVSKYISKETDSIVIFSGEGSDELAQGYIYFHKAPNAEAASDESLRLCRDLYLYDVLRADRVTSAWGLELRVPYLDHQFSSYYLSLPPALKQAKQGVEKYLLRKAFDKTGLLPDEILWRPKEAFSDGVASFKKTWFQYLREYVEDKITDDQMSAAAQKYPFNPPTSKEAMYYREVFERLFPGRAEWMPYYWMPKWVQATDPSHRTLGHYKGNETHQIQDGT